MKKALITIVLICGNLFVSFAQQDIRDIFQQFAAQPDVEHVRVGSFLMKMAQVFSDDQDTPFMKDISSVTVLSLENCKENVKNAFRIQAGKIKENGMEVLAEITDGSDEVRILALVKNQKIERFIVINTGADPCLIQIEGCIDLSHMEELVSQNTKGL